MSFRYDTLTVCCLTVRRPSNINGCMANSQKVKEWRKRTKQRMIDAMGGSCVVCGYTRCSASLGFHHLDPSKKHFGFGGLRANPKSWEKISEELRKCVLICNRCHGEVHDGITIIPINAKRYDESYAQKFGRRKMAPGTGLEPVTSALTERRSTIELPRNEVASLVRVTPF
jgi:hypothetical protein